MSGLDASIAVFRRYFVSDRSAVQTFRLWVIEKRNEPGALSANMKSDPQRNRSAKGNKVEHCATSQRIIFLQQGARPCPGVRH